MNKKRSISLKKQSGITIWHVLLLIVVAVVITLCAQSRTIPYLQQPIAGYQAPDITMPSMPDMPRIPGFSNSQPNTNPQPQVTRADYYSTPQPPPPPETTPTTHNGQVEWLLTSNNPTQQVAPPPADGVYELEYPREVTNGFYTVQVFSGYNSKSAYDLQRALKRDGYRAYVHEERDGRGILFKVRVGRYPNRADAFAMNSKIRRSYPRRMSSSFVLLRQEN